MNVIDTNIWLYAHDTRDAQKQRFAQSVIAQTQALVLPWQVGCEFIAASRKLAPLGFDETLAWKALEQMEAMASIVLMPDPQLWRDVPSLQTTHSLSFWDALLVAACHSGGVDTLYTEDMGSPRSIEGLALVNPFLTAPS